MRILFRLFRGLSRTTRFVALGTGIASLALPVFIALGEEIFVGDSGGKPQDTVLVPVTISGTNAISGLQMDLVYPANQAEGTGAMVSLGDAGHTPADHFVRSKQFAPGRTRIVLVSPTNAALPEDSGLQLPLSLKSAAPVGGADLTVQNIRFITTTGQVLVPTVRFGPITTWKKATFTTAERRDPTISGDDSDSDGDGSPTLLEYATGGDPIGTKDDDRSGSDGGFEMDSQDRTWFRLRYRQLKNRAGVSLFAEASNDMAKWVPLPGEPTGDEDATSIELEARLLSEGEERLFLRLNVRRTPVAPGAQN